MAPLLAGWSGATALSARTNSLPRRRDAGKAAPPNSPKSSRPRAPLPPRARNEVAEAIDLLVHYAGWTDKFPALFGTVNPVASAHFNFSVPEPTGVIAAIAPPTPGLLGFHRHHRPHHRRRQHHRRPRLPPPTPSPPSALRKSSTTAISPGGVVNILTGDLPELLPHLTTHMDVNGNRRPTANPKTPTASSAKNAALNIKRVALHPATDLSARPYKILAFQETKNHLAPHPPPLTPTQPRSH